MARIEKRANGSYRIQVSCGYSADGKQHKTQSMTWKPDEGMSQRQIETALAKLKKAHLIVTGNYNKAGYDRTTWYSVTNKGISISQNGEMDVTKNVNGFTQNAEPIPYIKPYIKSDNNIGRDTSPKKFQKPTLDELKQYIDEKCLNVDAERFLDFYESNGWKIGKNPMKSWEATVRNWDRREKKQNQTKEDSRLDFDRSAYQ